MLFATKIRVEDFLLALLSVVKLAMVLQYAVYVVYIAEYEPKINVKSQQKIYYL